MTNGPITNGPIDVESTNVDVAAVHGENTQTAGVGVVGVSPGASLQISGLFFAGVGVAGGAGDSGTGVFGKTTGGGIGVFGDDPTGWGVHGQSNSGAGVHGASGTSFGVSGQSTDGVAVSGESANNVGVFGRSPGKWGVWGVSDTNHGVHGDSTSGRGVHGISQTFFGVSGLSTDGIGVGGESTSNWGVWGKSETNHGVHGDSTSGRGVHGISQTFFGVSGVSTDHVGVGGESTNNIGVLGTSTTNVGVVGIGTQDAGINGLHGNPHLEEIPTIQSNHAGVFGASEDGAGVMGYSRDTSSFGVIAFGGIQASAVNHPLAGEFNGMVQVNGDLQVSGDIFLPGADCAEHFDMGESEKIEPGSVVVIDREGALRPSRTAYDRKVAGVVSGAGSYRPAIILDKRQSQVNRVPVALVGKVFCNVDAGYASIEVGDLLTSSPTPGCAMKADDPIRAFGAVIGKALRPLATGQGCIPILIALQ